ncbi:Yip1 family protein [Faecalibacter bovis]|uniref:Uncharacterized protein n=1 Tax=Faecalibacter bovis TaxID=2898187 RepID=A0ABX7XAB1_9FLAO|nr:Yip1 family protein [Faecalibacter bovis]QTV04856.1 hypothetical protein J9309_08600 [Faecalibacter bovis]
MTPEQKEARIKELQDELARRKAKLEKVHEKYDNMYLKFVEEGKLTREQAIREMEKYNRTDSNAYRALIQGIEDVVLEEQKVNELLIVENLIQEDAEYLKNVFNIDVNNIVKPTEEDFNRRLELSSKSSLNKAEKEEYDKLGDKILAFNVARGTMVKDGISLMDLIYKKNELLKNHKSLEKFLDKKEDTIKTIEENKNILAEEKITPKINITDKINLSNNISTSQKHKNEDENAFALIVTFNSIFMITALITHIWTVIIAFTQAGIIGGVLTFILPFLSEIYWMIKMFGVNDTYAYIALAHIILAIPLSLLSKS